MLRRVCLVSARTKGLQSVAPATIQRFVSAEEQAELDREAKLRQDFMKKRTANQGNGFFGQIMQAAQEAQARMEQQKAGGAGGSSSSSGSTPFGSSPFGANAGAAGGARPNMGSFLYGLLVYTTAFYMLVITFQMRKEQPMAMAVSGAPRWAPATETMVAYFAVRILLGSSKQQELQDGFASYRKSNPNVDFYQYLLTVQPHALQGNTTTAAELLNTLAAVSRGTGGQMEWATHLGRISRWGDDKSRVDAGMANIKRQYPQYVANATTPSFGGGWQGGYQQPHAYSQMYHPQQSYYSQQQQWQPSADQGGDSQQQQPSSAS